MKVQLKKGQEFWFVTNWDGLGTMRIRRLTCQACGKVIVRATESASGNFVKHEIQQRLLNTSSEPEQSFNYEHIFAIDCDIEQEVMKLANLYIEQNERYNTTGRQFKASIIHR
jgi:hypothetical protein